MTAVLDRRLFIHLLATTAIASAIGCKATKVSQPPSGMVVYTLIYVPGPAWIDGSPPQDQGLEDHFAFMGQQFADGVLVANGPFMDAIEGFYVFAVDGKAAVREIVSADPAVVSKKLEAALIEPWYVEMDELGRTIPEQQSLFVLEYGPGPQWGSAKPPSKLELEPHRQYTGDLFNEGTILAGGSVPGSDHGRYVVAARSLDDARTLADADPGVHTGTLTVRVRPWSAAQRQSVREATARHQH